MTSLLTNDEAELYDRQIRLWGVNAQNRIRQSKVLMLGFNGVASEVAKILVLAGIDSLTIVDDMPIQESDITSNLFCRPNLIQNGEAKRHQRTHAVAAKLATLNPLVKVSIDNSSITSKDLDYLKEYDLVTLHTFLTIEEISTINENCRKCNIKFYTVLDFGYFAFMFNDLGREFKFAYEEFSDKVKSSEDESDDPHLGEEQNPISIYGEANSNDSIGSNGSFARPKKKRRVHSPTSDDKKAQDNNLTSEKRTILESMPYVTFREMISLNGNNFSKSTSPVLVLSIAILKFYSEHKKLPMNEEELEQLADSLTSLEQTMQLNEKVMQKLDPNWRQGIQGSLSPVCAIAGGVAGQDMIRALSAKDIPLCNTFVFDGITMNGLVEKVGLSNLSNSKKQPIVRDFLEISDDDSC